MRRLPRSNPLDYQSPRRVESQPPWWRHLIWGPFAPVLMFLLVALVAGFLLFLYMVAVMSGHLGP